ncbi:M23 family metallopeptidase [Allopontixanthobacter sp.]|uniref:M23 family metallopeptidase n=1 Tax=Allopontixanthobacter sp. TaxID=2906452 RepID=UPI002AB9F4CE|nr:M23 family metallopeptidase [Allopontixanthobacter sp.]MDZ4306520.1 M23 family metallopeptidase [Allopontixanthobacter sp.]
MATNWIDRTLTIVITATVTSALWITAGGTLMEMADSEGQRKATRPADAAPSPQPVADPSPAAESGELTEGGSALDQGGVIRAGAERNGNLMVPVLNVRPSDLTDSFTDARSDTASLHEAIDIMAPEGTTVVAAAPGTIEKLFTSKAGGKTIYVRSPDRLTIHYYAHLSDYAQGLKEGQRIRRGQRLGGVGSTGNASPDAPHLHFAILRTTADAEWWEPANALNPYTLLTRK